MQANRINLSVSNDLAPQAGQFWPNLFLVGVPKAGTTYLSEMLSLHPKIFCSNVKSPNFMNSDAELFDLPSGDEIRADRHIDAALIRDEKSYLALQLRSPFYVGSAGFGLMCASPDGPCDDVGGPDASLRKTNSDAPDFLN